MTSLIRRSSAAYSLCLALASCALLPSSKAFAAPEDNEIATDRPDFVESSDVVGRGRFQFEVGLSSERNTSAGVRSRTTSTPTLLRLGINETWELRLETDGRLRTRERDLASGLTTSSTAYADVALGVKWHAADADGALPAVAWLAHVDLASGSASVRGQGARPSLRMVAEWELPHDMSFGLMPGLVADRDASGRRFVAGIAGIVLGKGWGDRWHTFIEIAAPVIARSSHGGSLLTLDLGAAYLLAPNLQIDISVNKGMNRHTPDMVWAVGLSGKF